MLVPVPVPATATASVGDPALDILGDYFKAVLTAWLGAAWLARAPGEPVVRTLSKHDPEEIDFCERDLPLLSVWRDSDEAPKRLGDGYQETETTLNILWVPPPTTQTNNAQRFPFFSAFSKAMALAVIHERDPSYVHASDIVLGVTTDEATAYGSDVQKLADIDWWRLARVQRVPIEVPTGDRVFRYPAYLATLLIGETTETDPYAFASTVGAERVGTELTTIEFDLNSGGDTPLTRQEAVVPIPEVP